MYSSFTRKLNSVAQLSDDEVRRFEQLTEHRQRIGPRETIVRDGDEPDLANVVLDGWACRYKMLPDGRRQIIGLLLPGDMCDPYVFLLRAVDHTIASLTPLFLARVPGRLVREMADTNPKLAEAFWWQAMIMAEVHREWTVSLGRRTALERLAHLFCELAVRLDIVGLGGGADYDMPLTQHDLADALGLSTVHINRSLQELRGSGLIDLRQRRLTIRDRALLEELAMFDAAYLHRRAPGRPTPAPGRAGL